MVAWPEHLDGRPDYSKIAPFPSAKGLEIRNSKGDQYGQYTFWRTVRRTTLRRPGIPIYLPLLSKHCVSRLLRAGTGAVLRALGGAGCARGGRQVHLDVIAACTLHGCRVRQCLRSQPRGPLPGRGACRNRLLSKVAPGLSRLSGFGACAGASREGDDGIHGRQGGQTGGLRARYGTQLGIRALSLDSSARLLCLQEPTGKHC